MISYDSMQIIYNTLVATHTTRMSPLQFKKMAMKNGLKTIRKRPHGASREIHVIRGAQIHWRISELARQELISRYFTEQTDKKLLESA